jgi:response regulator RpfG family c-di-GMP phosphodiesterase
MPEREVIDHIRSQSGAHFDPRAVELFMRLPEEIGCDDPIR